MARRAPDPETTEARSHVVTAAELRSRGVGSRAVRDGLRRGRLARLHRGVYLVDPRAFALLDGDLRMLVRLTAAVLAAGAGSELRGRSAAALHGIAELEDGPVDVRVPTGRNARRTPDLRTQRSGDLDGLLLRGLPTSGLERTLLDLGADVRTAEVVLALCRAEGLGILDARGLEDECARRPGLPGHVDLRLARHVLTRCGTVVRSLLEAELLVLCLRFGLPLPAANARVETDAGWLEVDALWVEAGVVVECDGFEVRGRGGRRRFDDDRARWAAIAAAGYRLLVVTWTHVMHDGATVARRISATLGAESHRRPGARAHRTLR